jgi:hypothetical protein
MRLIRAAALLVLITASCGGDGGGGPAPGDYFAQLQRVSENAHIQERGLRRDLRIRLEEAPPGEDRMTVLTVFIDQSAGLYQDVVDALGQLDPPPELASAQQAYLEAWQGQLDLVIDVRDAGFPGPVKILKELGRPVFQAAKKEIRTRCEDLQAAVEANGSNVDLVCDGRPS